jgi:hypothetical protein
MRRSTYRGSILKLISQGKNGLLRRRNEAAIALTMVPLVVMLVMYYGFGVWSWDGVKIANVLAVASLLGGLAAKSHAEPGARLDRGRIPGSRGI